MRINKFLTENWKWFIAITITLLAGFIPALLSFFDKPDKGLAYEYWSYPLLSVSTLAEDSSFVLLHNDVQIDSLSSLFFIVYNSGNVPIEKDDYETDISLTLGDEISILNARTVSTHPEGIPTNVRYSNSTITLDALLLNPGDEIRIQGLVTGTVADHKAQVRIAGVEKIQYQPVFGAETNANQVTVYLGFTLSGIFIVLGIMFIIVFIREDHETVGMIYKDLGPNPELRFMGMSGIIVYIAGMVILINTLGEIHALNSWILGPYLSQFSFSSITFFGMTLMKKKKKKTAKARKIPQTSSFRNLAKVGVWWVPVAQ